METLLQIIFGVVVMPVTQWIKSKIPSDLPFLNVIISYALAIGATWLVAQIYAPTMVWRDIIVQALAITGTAAQATHAIVKSVKSNG